MSSRARRTSSSRSILFSTSSITRWNLMFTSVSASRPSAPIHHHLRCTTTTPYTPVLLLQGDLSADVAPWPVSLEAALDRVQEFQRGAAVEGAGVVDGEGAARDVFGTELAVAGAPHEVVDFAGEPHEVQLVSVGDDGHDEGIFEVDSYADVYALSEDYAVLVPDRVENRMLPEALDDRPYDERQVG